MKKNVLILISFILTINIFSQDNNFQKAVKQYMDERKYSEAEALLLINIDLLDAKNDSKFIQNSYELLVSIYRITGKKNEGITILNTLLAMTDEERKKIEVLKSLIEFYQDFRDYENVSILNKRLLNDFKDTLAYLKYEQINSINTYNIPRYIRICKEALPFYSQRFGENSIEFAIGLINLAGASKLDNPRDSIIINSYISQANEILENLISSGNVCIPYEDLYVASLFANMVGLQNYVDYIELTSEITPFVSEIYELMNFLLLADVKSNIGDYFAAFEIYTHTLQILNNIDKNNFHGFLFEDFTISCYSKMGELLYKMYCYSKKEYHEALTLAEMALRMACHEARLLLEQTGNKYINEVSNVLRYLSYIYEEEGKFDESIEITFAVFQQIQSEIYENWLYMSENQRNSFWYNNNLYFQDAIHILFRADNEKVSKELFSLLIFSKGLLLNSSIELSKIISESENKNLIYKYNRILTINYLLNKSINKVDSLVKEKEELEYELIKESQAFGDYTRNLKLNWEDVHNSLLEKDIAIEFIDFDVPNSDTTLYAALILRKDWDAPKMITLFEKKELDTLLAAGNSEAERAEKRYSGDEGKQITKLIWGNLAAYLNEGDNIYFAPSGLFHHLAIEYLPTDDNRRMNEMYNMYRLSSTKQICYNYQSPNYEKAVLYGGLVYDLKEETMIAESRVYEQTRDKYTMRGFEIDTANRAGWKKLDGAKKEVVTISNILTKNHIQNTVYEGEKGNEESFRALSGQKNNILHIATHGFFYSSEVAQKKDYFRILDDNKPVIDNSMRRSGLILSGGNAAWRGKPLPEGIEDGVLTAQEIMSLDLRGADLVVLSACETGLGDVTGEGVFGLQRAFKMAGAQTLIMSLWKVSDAATELMMSTFYENLLSGKSKRDAFLSAQEAVRTKYKEPYFWAAFIMLD